MDTMIEVRPRGFWRKVVRSSKRAGKGVIRKALEMFLAAQSPSTPRWAKGVIYGALVYFITPLDTIPDAIPFGGFADDGTILAAAIAATAIYITPEIRKRADEILGRWFK